MLCVVLQAEANEFFRSNVLGMGGDEDGGPLVAASPSASGSLGKDAGMCAHPTAVCIGGRHVQRDSRVCMDTNMCTA